MTKSRTMMSGVAALALSLSFGGSAYAADVSDLGASLTPIGAERAGNAAGTIPAWEGGDVAPIAGWSQGDPRVDKYASDAKLFSIDASNVDKYADKLSEGQIALVKRYDGYRMDVYPTRRTCGYSQAIYDATKANVGVAKLSAQGGILAGHGGFLFPIPETGAQAIANYRSAFQGKAVEHVVSMAVVQSNGSYNLGTGVVQTYSPFFDEGSAMGSYMSALIYRQLAPAASVGAMLLTVSPYDGSNETWGYIPGLRRVKKAPTGNYDNPVPGQDGLRTFDQTFMFNGLSDRYDWKLEGKKELYIPYNSTRYREAGMTVDKIMGKKYPNRDLARYELHRVWVLEATAKPEYRSTFSRRVFYLDEDTWAIVAADLYDGKGKLWRVEENHLFMAPEIPACVTGADFYFDLNADRYLADNLILGKGNENYRAEATVNSDMFSPDALRRGGRR